MTRVALNFSTATVAASPTAAAETVVAILNGVTCQFAGDTFKIHGYVNVAVDADATAVTLAVRRGSLAGDPVGGSAPQNVVAGDETGGFNASIDVNDTPGDVANAVYVLTIECDGATGPSTVGLATLSARCD